jgi:hypothetical protein
MSHTNNGKFITQTARAALLVLSVAAVALGQQGPVGTPTPANETPAAKDTISGRYEGTAKAAGVADIQLTIELKNEAGKLSGRLITPQGPVEISEGALAGDKVSLKFGSRDGALTAQLQNDKLTGDWITGAQKRSVELKKVDPAAMLTGEWLALADVQGQGFPFSLSLKIDGEKVTGSSSSQLGDSPIASGSWKDGRLTFVLESGTGQIGMTATLVDGKLVGDFDYAGQMQGKWVATKKTP